VPVTVGEKVTVRVGGAEMVRVGVESGLRLRVEVPLAQLDGERVGEEEGEREAVEVSEVVAYRERVASGVEVTVGVLEPLPVAKEAVGEPLVVLLSDPESVDVWLPVELPLPLPRPPLGVEVLDTTSVNVRVKVGWLVPEAVEVTEVVAEKLKKDALPVTLGVMVGQRVALPVGEAVPVALKLMDRVPEGQKEALSVPLADPEGDTCWEAGLKHMRKKSKQEKTPMDERSQWQCELMQEEARPRQMPKLRTEAPFFGRAQDEVSSKSTPSNPPPFLQALRVAVPLINP
jgi:hypothetical protein